jgi:uncharacterized membrane protein
MVKKIDQAGLDKIQAAVQAAEKTTRGEIVPVALSQASDYEFVLYRSPLLVSLILSGLLFIFTKHLSAGQLFLGQLISFVVIYVGLRQFSNLKYNLLTTNEVQEAIDRKSLELFYEYNLEKTQNRTGILIAVYLNERRVKILADEGINRMVPQKTWDLVISDMISEIKNKDVASAIILGVNRCGEILSQKVPTSSSGFSQNPNELNDKLRTKL